jgi:hypothetical protein
MQNLCRDSLENLKNLFFGLDLRKLIRCQLSVDKGIPIAGCPIHRVFVSCDKWAFAPRAKRFFTLSIHC